MFKKLRTVIYHVNDIAKAKDWYQQLTGITPYFDEPFYVGFDINGYELGLDPDMSGVEKGNHVIAYWAVDDIQKTVNESIAKGAKLISPVRNVGGTIEVAIVEDPFGNHLGLIAGT